MPKSRPEYWGPKLMRNIERDKAHQKMLREAGWNVLVVWECEIEKTPDIALRTITQSLALQRVKN
jgi:DNA mismatch endonuclease (patch repair protein)